MWNKGAWGVEAHSNIIAFQALGKKKKVIYSTITAFQALGQKNVWPLHLQVAVGEKNYN
jgi:hypothetical protein